MCLVKVRIEPLRVPFVGYENIIFAPINLVTLSISVGQIRQASPFSLGRDEVGQFFHKKAVLKLTFCKILSVGL